MTKKTNDWINYAAEICRSKNDPKGRYINVIKDFEALEGSNLVLQKHEDYLMQLVEKNFISEDEMREKLEKKDWVSYIITVPPQEEVVDENSYKVKDKDGWINEAFDIRQGKSGIYIKIKKSFNAEAGAKIPLKKFRDEVERKFEMNFIDETKRDKLLENCSWLHYIGSIPPKE